MFLDYNFRNYNYRLFLYVLLLNITGVLIIRSASNQDASMVVKQIIGILVGLTAVVILSLVDWPDRLFCLVFFQIPGARKPV